MLFKLSLVLYLFSRYNAQHYTNTITPMSHQTIFPTSSQPLYVVTKNGRSQLTATKFWHVVINDSTTYRLEEIRTSNCSISKKQSFVEAGLIWSEEKPVTPKNTTVALLLYDVSANKLSHASVKQINKKVHFTEDLPEPVINYINFATNPLHQFLPDQAKALHSQIRSWVPKEVIEQFEETWPCVKNGKPTMPSFLAPVTYPSTIQEAMDIFDALENTNTPNHLPNAPNEPPILYPIPQPLPNPFPIPNLKATNFRTGRAIHPNTYNISLHVTKEGKHSSRREVFYANDIPISPLKSTVAVLFADANPNSQTFQQPIIKSINIAKSTPQEVAAFLGEYRSNMTPEQLAQFEQPSYHTQPFHQPQPSQSTGEPQMSTNTIDPLCAECGTPFIPSRITSRFCCEQCRTETTIPKVAAKPIHPHNPNHKHQHPLFPQTSQPARSSKPSPLR